MKEEVKSSKRSIRVIDSTEIPGVSFYLGYHEGGATRLAASLGYSVTPYCCRRQGSIPPKGPDRASNAELYTVVYRLAHRHVIKAFAV
jgi:hypothetical protein